MRLLEYNNPKATRLFHELLVEIKEKGLALGYPILEPIAEINDIIGTFNSVRTYGQCVKAKRHIITRKTMLFNITLNKCLVDNGTDHEIKEVLLHELIHTTANCFNHKSTFKHRANLLNHYLGYNALHGSYERNRLSERKRVYKCTCCGKLFHRARRINLEIARCGDCMGKLKELN